jgi:hypothetical protein
MTRISNYFYRKVSLLTATILTVLTFSYLFFVMMKVAKGFEVVDSSTQSLGTSFGLSAEMIQDFLEIRSAEMIHAYVDCNMIWDNIFALLYGLMYVLWISLLFKPYSAKVKWLNLLPFVQTIFDWLENFQLVNIANEFLANATVSTFKVSLASAFVMTKWITSMLVFVMIIGGIVLKIRNMIQSKK